jgi:hypothetical protein
MITPPTSIHPALPKGRWCFDVGNNMTSQQQRYVYRELLGWFRCACVPLQAVVSSVNDAIGKSPYDTVSEEAQDFVRLLLEKGKLQVGSLADSEEWILLPWPGKMTEHITRVLAAMPLGESLENELSIWFDLTERKVSRKKYDNICGN